jgi:succinate dehydrogenase flavin-adding protein (antitoxin of CptAB toxin-antitoxin module)
METFEGEFSTLLREVGRRIMAWVLKHVEPDNDAEAPSRRNICKTHNQLIRSGVVNSLP